MVATTASAKLEPNGVASMLPSMFEQRTGPVMGAGTGEVFLAKRTNLQKLKLHRWGEADC